MDRGVIESDEEFAQCKKAKAYHFFDFEISDYPEVYVDAKLVDYGFLVEAARRGNEPTRAGFTGAKILFVSQKRLLSEVEGAENKPEGILEIANDLIANPSFAKADVFIDKILNYEGWEVKPDISIGTYIENDLWGWMNGNTSVGDW